MPADNLHAGRIRLLAIAGCLCLFGTSLAAASPHRSATNSSFGHAQRRRELLERRPERERTRRDYDRAMDAYRAIYHADPASPHAPASVFAVADLLAEQGRIFHDQKSSHDAIGQYEFLRANYPHSGLGQSALLAEGEIDLRDLNDSTGARSAFEKFLRLYPRSPRAAEARIELRDLRHAAHSRARHSELAQARESEPTVSAATPPSRRVQHTPERERTITTLTKSVPTARERSSHPLVKAAEPITPAIQRPAALPLVTGIRFWSTPQYTRIAIDLQNEVRYQAIRVSGPDRIFFNLYGARLSPQMAGKSDQVIDGGFLSRIHAEQFSPNVTRVVLNVSNVSEYYAFFLPHPDRLIIDVRGGKSPSKTLLAAVAPASVVARGSRHASGNLVALSTIGLGPNTVAADRLGDPLSRPRSEIAALKTAPNRIRATLQPTTAPVEQTFGPQSEPQEPPGAAQLTAAARASEPTSAPKRTEIHSPAVVASGQLSMSRALGLKINRIVIDAGHGGHDSGTLGPDGMEEKNVVLDVALRLGALLKQRLGADVIYTRDDDTFIPLETRTAIANKDRADLFISVHANSSPDPAARGVETYFLNFTTSADALEVAARENAVSNQSIHQLSDLVKKIALQDKIEESREFAADVQQSLYQGLESGNPGLKDRGVKKAPFVVLIGANMPSILTEISFLTNPQDASELRQPRYRERIAEALYRGVARYVDSLNGVRLAEVAPGATP